MWECFRVLQFISVLRDYERNECFNKLKALSSKQVNRVNIYQVVISVVSITKYTMFGFDFSRIIYAKNYIRLQRKWKRLRSRWDYGARIFICFLNVASAPDYYWNFEVLLSLSEGFSHPPGSHSDEVHLSQMKYILLFWNISCATVAFLILCVFILCSAAHIEVI